MPVIACPGCGKQYKIAATAAGQDAKCACGKRFRLGAAHDKSTAASAATATSIPKAKSTPAPDSTKVAAQVAPTPTEDFWDDALAIADKPKAARPTTATGQVMAASASQPGVAKTGVKPVVQGTSKEKAVAAKKKKRKKSTSIRWGFDWGKVVAGLGTFLIFGGITAAMAMSTGRISLYLAGAAIVGLFTALNGLMGEEGIW